MARKSSVSDTHARPGDHIWFYSQPGKGTTFNIYFPIGGETSLDKKAAETMADGDLRGSETILLTEDNEQVREISCAILEEQGYRVFLADRGSEALEILDEQDGAVDLLLTDIVMPGMNGRELYEKAVEKYPGLKVLFMSGYSEEVIAHDGVMDDGINFIKKPFTVQVLAAKVREVLEG